MPRIFVNAGHFAGQNGAVANGVKESVLAMKIRDKLKLFLPEAIYVPDELDLANSIRWIKLQNPNKEDLAIDIHLNYRSDKTVGGTEVYGKDFALASIFAEKISSILGIPNRGAKDQKETYVGELGWLNYLLCRAVVVEICYISNENDFKLIITDEGQKKAARGIFEAIQTIVMPIAQKKEKNMEEIRKFLQSFAQYVDLAKFKEWFKM